MRRKIICLLLSLVMIIGLIPVFNTTVSAAAATDADMDALTALGIDSGEAPDGYDPYSTDNPYGRNTIQVSPVSELYKVGLDQKVEYDTSYHYDGDKLQSGGETKEHVRSQSIAKLQSVIYGHNKWGKDEEAILGSGEPNTIVGGGSTEATGNYTLISEGTISDTAATNIPGNGYLKSAKNAYTQFGSFKYAMSTVSSGNFDGNKEGLKAQTAMVYTSEYTKNGGLYLRFGDATSGNYGSNAKELLTTGKEIGNPGLKYEGELVENFAENPYQLRNYLQVTTGDWNNDGLDEVAVYIPEKGNSRIVVYALQLTENDNKPEAFKNPDKWKVAWTYNLREGDVVSNMVSFTNGDVNQDGIDDLAGTWGYYYGPEQNKGSKAVVMFGGKGSKMLQKSQEFDLTYGTSNIVRASFAFGDMAGANGKALILCGQSDADLRAGNTQTRYVALYDWNGNSFITNIKQNFDLFEHDKDKYTWPVMGTRTELQKDKFYSLPFCVSNTAVISQGLGNGGDLLYCDSLIIEYTEDGLNLKEAWDNTTAMQSDAVNCVDYVEYDATAGDITGNNGAATFATMAQTLSNNKDNGVASYKITGTAEVPNYVIESYYKNWFCKLFGIKSYRIVQKGTKTVSTGQDVSVDYPKFVMGKAYMVTAIPVIKGTGSEKEIDFMPQRSEEDYSAGICLANTDKDSSYMSYSGKHYFTYTDPKVLTVLASPPYFKDLLDRDDLSGNYGESTTSYSSTKGSGSGSTSSVTISVGAYVSYEQDIKVFGVTVASVEAEAVVKAGFTWDTETTSTLEQTITYTAASGEDMVAFYSIPMEIYEYTSYVPDGVGEYDKVLTTVNIPHEAAVRLLSLDEYEFIAKDYSVLPKISDNVLTHEIGEPSSYPSSTKGYNVLAEYGDDPSAVGFSSTEGGSAIAQEIAMSTEKSSAFTVSGGIEAKAGAGAGGFKVGVIAGVEGGGGSVDISTNGSSFTGELQNMPIEAQPYGYGMNWRIFCYIYSNAGSTFPVVSYLVSDVHNPSPLPEDFNQNTAETTSDCITLDWTYDRTIAGFRIFRYYEFPEGSGSYEVAFVPFNKGVKDDKSGIYHFSYEDEGLNPYSEYKYQIKSVRGIDPKESIYCEPLVCRTKTEVGYPVINLIGIDDDGILPIYPDADSTVTLDIKDKDSYNAFDHQWQKLSGGNFVNIPGRTSDSFTIKNAGAADDGIYRCRVNTIYYDENAAQEYYISAYSDSFGTAYRKRTSIGKLTAQEVISGTNSTLKADIELYSVNKGHSAAPSGNVTFMVKGTDYLYSETVKLDQQTGTKYFEDLKETKLYSTASLSLKGLPKGVYTVTAYYSGSKIFKDYDISKETFVVIGDAEAYKLDLTAKVDGEGITKFTYEDSVFSTLSRIGKDGGNITSTPEVGAIFKLRGTGEEADIDFASGSPTPDVGSYIIDAYTTEGNLVASRAFTVSKRPITVWVENNTNVSGGTVSSNQPAIKCSEINGDKLEALELTYTAANSAGNIIDLNDDTEPGNYKVTACASEVTPENLYNNYNISYVSGNYTIIGLTYWTEVIAAPYTSDGATRPVGTAGITNETTTTVKYSSGSTIVMYAAPKAGFEVDKWIADFKDSPEKTQVGGSTFTFDTQACDVEVTVTFRPSQIGLTTIASPSAGGTVTCSDPTFSSGAIVGYGAEFEFKASPAEGYHFKNWRIISGAKTETKPGIFSDDGSNKVTVTVGDASTIVYADFERDGYSLSLAGDIIAYYWYDNDNDPSTENIKKFVTSGGIVVGDTTVIIEPKIGYSAEEGAFFVLNGDETGESTRLEFIITEDSSVTLQTMRNKYKVTLSAENGYITTKVNGVLKNANELNSLDGGTAIVFNAKAKRSYIFHHWEVNSVESGTDETLTIDELGEDSTVEAVFISNTPYTIRADVSNESRGSMKYTLYDIYGELMEESVTMPRELTIYEGESIVLIVSVKTGSMVEQWQVNDDNIFTNEKTYTVDEINDDIDVTVYLKAASNYKVYYAAEKGDAEDTNGGLTAKMEGVSFDSGELCYGGSNLKFEATPDANYMLDYWTVTEGNPSDSENDTAVDENGINIVDPIYEIDSLWKHLTVRAYFSELQTSTVTLAVYDSVYGDICDSNGISEIVYITPITSDDDGLRDSTKEKVRVGGTVKMMFRPSDNYDTDAETLTEIFEKQINDDALVEVESEEDGDGYTVIIRNLAQDIDLSEENIYYRVYSIDVGDSDHGSVFTDVAKARRGEIVTITITPDKGYKLKSLDINSKKEITQIDDSEYTFEMPGKDITISAEFETISYKITLAESSNGTIKADNKKAKEGDVVTLTVLPDNGYELKSVWIEPQCNLKKLDLSKYSFVMIDGDVTVNAKFDRISTPAETSRDSGKGGSGGTAAPKPEQIKIEVSVGSNKIEVNVVITGDTAKLDIGESDLNAIAKHPGDISFDVTGFEGINAIAIPGSLFDMVASNESINTFSINFNAAHMSFDRQALLAIGSAGYDDITFSADIVDVNTLTKEQKNIVEDKPVLDLILTSKGKTISDFDLGTVQVTMPYELKEGENSESIVIWYLNEKNILECVNGYYDEESKSVNFVANHFSKYIIGHIPFKDVARGAWYFNSVSFAYANKLFAGVKEEEFAPDMLMTRGMFATVLWNMEGRPEANYDAGFSDVKSGQWYEQAVNWAAMQGITSGYGNGLYGVNDEVTREQAAVILMNYSKYKYHGITTGAGLQQFSDEGKISDWARPAMEWANKTGLISGVDDSNLAPKDGATRAQISIILQRFLNTGKH